MRRIHPRPGVIPDAQVGHQNCQPGQVLDAVDAAAGPVQADGPLNLSAAGPRRPQLRITIALGLAEID